MIGPRLIALLALGSAFSSVRAQSIFIEQNARVTFDEKNSLVFEDVGRPVGQTTAGKFIRLHITRDGERSDVDLTDSSGNSLVAQDLVELIHYTDKDNVLLTGRAGHLADFAILYNLSALSPRFNVIGRNFHLTSDAKTLTYQTIAYKASDEIKSVTVALSDIPPDASLPGAWPPAVPAAPAASPVAAAAPTTATKPVVLPGDGMNGHDFLYAGEWDTRKPVQTAYIVKGGKVVWSYEIPSGKGEISDCSLLSNGNVIIAHQHGALVVGPDKQVLWTYTCPTTATEVHTIQAIGLDRVMIFVNGNPAKVMTYDIKTNTMEKSFEVAVGNPKSTHGQVRRMRITPQGTILIAIQDAKRVDEYDMDGKKLATTNLNGVWDAVRLKNGNMLVTTQKTHVQELDKDGKVVWELQPSDLPGIPIYQFQEANRLDNGNTVMTNWIPNTFKAPQWPGTMQALEVTPDKKPVWGLSQWSDPDLGPATCLQILGQSGTPEEHTMQR